MTRYLGLVDKLGDETERAIWEEVIGSLRFFADLIDDEGDRAVFDRYVARVLEKPFARIGWDARAGEPLDARPLRRSFIVALGRAGYAPVVREAQARFAASAKTPIDAAIRPAVFDVVGRYADEAAYRALLRSMRSATELEHKQQALSGLRQMRDPKLVQRMMELMLTGESMDAKQAQALGLVHASPTAPRAAQTERLQKPLAHSSSSAHAPASATVPSTTCAQSGTKRLLKLMPQSAQESAATLSRQRRARSP